MGALAWRGCEHAPLTAFSLLRLFTVSSWQDEDTCYSYWIGASLAMLGGASLIDSTALGAFAHCCEYHKVRHLLRLANRRPSVRIGRSADGRGLLSAW